VVIAEISIFPLGTGSPGVSEYVAAARAQAAVFELGVGRAYTVIKMDDRRDVEERSAEAMVRSVRERP
jgi:uncharacterized protein YqgV (UPF0045/DUF77 family)